jgi:hypothetical protein
MHFRLNTLPPSLRRFGIVLVYLLQLTVSQCCCTFVKLTHYYFGKISFSTNEMSTVSSLLVQKISFFWKISTSYIHLCLKQVKFLCISIGLDDKNT